MCYILCEVEDLYTYCIPVTLQQLLPSVWITRQLLDSDEDVMEITQEELQKWIRKGVKKSKMVFLSAEKRCQLLSEKREKQRAGLVKLTQVYSHASDTLPLNS